MKYKTTPIQPESKRYWTEGNVQLMNGDIIDIIEVANVEITRESNGTLSYGKRDEAYDGWFFREVGGGGVITIPYVLQKNELYIGLLLEDRPNMGEEPVWSAIGGFIDPGEAHAVAQQRESVEESGIDTSNSVITPGLGIIANRTFFVADAKTEGVKTYFYPLTDIEIEQVDDRRWNIVDTTKVSFEHKKIDQVGFFHWKDLPFVTADGLALAGAYHLLSHLESK